MGRLIKDARQLEQAVTLQLPMPDVFRGAPSAPVTNAFAEHATASVAATAPLVSIDEQRKIEEEAATAKRIESLELARAEGHAEGRAAGELAARSEWKDRLSTVEELIRALTIERRENAAMVLDAAIEVAFAAVCRFVAQASATPEGVASMVRQTMDEVPETRSITSIRLSPDDWNVLGAEGRSMLEQSGTHPLEIIKDPRVKLGGCIVGMDRGSLDARLEVQLARMKQLILDVRGRMEAADGH